MIVVRDEFHRQAGYLRTLESMDVKLSAEVTAFRERQTSIEVWKEEKRGLETKVRVLEELREKFVRLEAEVDAGRREREAW
jgi:mitotic spindle assembly checkpoint protein MAD1